MTAGARSSSGASSVPQFVLADRRGPGVGVQAEQATTASVECDSSQITWRASLVSRSGPGAMASATRSELPRTGTGTVLKHVLREPYLPHRVPAR